jgi:sugar lactone lactonase YvrE
MTFEVFVDGLSFPEAPRWQGGRLWLSDFYTHRVLSVGLDGEPRVEATVPNRPSGLGFLADGDFLVVSMLDHRLLRFGRGGSRVVADMSAWAGGPSNDMVALPSGRAYVGNFGFDKNNGAPMRPASLVKVEPDGTVTEVARELMFPNGMVITPDGRTLIVAETFANRLTAFGIAEDGRLGQRRIFCDLPGHRPDGICLDAEGAVWVADAFGNRVVRVLDGRVATTLSTCDRGAYACALGGVDGRLLFVCTNTGAGHAMADKRDGRVEVARVPVPAW